MIILDTNVLSELARPAPDQTVVGWLSAQPPDQMRLTVITEAELLTGIARMPAGRRKTELANTVASVLNDEFKDRILPFDRPAAAGYAPIFAARRASGRPISQFDCQIAAIARANEAAVATRNTRDFEDCGIEVINPWRR